MTSRGEKGHHVCPWYMAYLFDNPLRSLVHNPEKILGPYVKRGMTVLDVGCGMGFFSLGLARMVGPEGRVISLDLQVQMLEVLRRRARRRNLGDRIDRRLVGEGAFPVTEPVDFANCFWMVHEVPYQRPFFRELARILKPGAHLLIAEPKMHVSPEELEKTIRAAAECGLTEAGRPGIRMSHAVVLERSGIRDEG